MFSLVADPTNAAASGVSDSQIDIAFTPNNNNDNVLITWNYDGIFTTPSGVPPAVGQPFAGGTLLYNGTTSPVHHIGLNPLTTYYYKLFSYDGADYSTGVTVDAQTLFAADFTVEITVMDNCANSTHPLIFGTAAGATDCFDPGYDESALPPPPFGVPDARFNSCSEAFFTDIRATNTVGEVIWDLHYQPGEGCSPVTFNWDPAQLPPTAIFI